MAGARPNGGGEGGARFPGRVSKSMRIGAGPRTSVRLEAEFWAWLAELAAARRVPLPALVNEVAAAKPRSRSLASALRVFALQEARLRKRPNRSRAPPIDPRE